MKNDDSTGKNVISKHTAGMFAALMLALVMVSACDNSIHPIEKQEDIFSIYGALDIHQKTNFIRIKPLNTTLTGETMKSMEAIVTLENLTTGDREILQDSVVNFDEVSTHNFATMLPIEPENTYQLTIEDEDGKLTRTKATAPAIAQPTVSPVYEKCKTPVTLSFDSINDPSNIDFSVGIEYNSDIYWDHIQSYPSYSEETQTVTVEFTPIDYINHALDAYHDNIYYYGCHHLSDDLFRIRYTHFGPDFNKKGDSAMDSIRLREFGAYYDSTFTFRIDTSYQCLNC